MNDYIIEVVHVNNRGVWVFYVGMFVEPNNSYWLIPGTYNFGD